MTSKYKIAALARGETRTIEIERKVLAAMDIIMAEIRANDGIYPQNGGAISKNEVARRAGIGKTTFFTPKQQELNARVDVWLETLKMQETVGRTRVRRTYAERVETWKDKYQALENSHRKTELDLQVAEAEREEALSLIIELQAKNTALLEQLQMASTSKITSFPKKKK
ncbi:hypothetical protein C4K04_4774 [Pseudomonas chlororaphis]|uniref:Uncharacterized protein n=1 Tax=Pseudomonas chlororaphis TaxID=587753 RepID=A0A3G7TVS7_9PSED|nr:hypothetical protein [Pseudomonas chlororaphis]AZE50429.1 hypothetical protein C4K04_4774 [Pseudomonas chlororaphis]